MTTRLLPSVVFGPDTTPSLAAIFPTMVPQPEVLVYEAILTGTQPGTVHPEDDLLAELYPAGVAVPPTLGFYEPPVDGMPPIRAIRGFPPDRAQIPLLGIVQGPDSQDPEALTEGAGFAGDVYATDSNTGQIVGSASYYSHPQYTSVLVDLGHQNRDERDRLHDLLKLQLFALQRTAPGRDPLYRQIRIDAAKDEATSGPPEGDQPITLYHSLFTVHVYYEMLQATDVVGVGGLIPPVEVHVTLAE